MPTFILAILLLGFLGHVNAKDIMVEIFKK